MNKIDPLAARLYDIAEQLDATNRRVVQRDASGQIIGMLDVPTNVPRLVEAGIAVMEGAWSHHPETIDELGRVQQLDAMRAFCVTAAEHVQQAAPLRERVRQLTNAIRLNWDDDR
jgi:hypothetical protein